jgi:transcriptional regulator with XRE-family HTH domain
VSFRYLGANLRRLRLERRLSQAALALLLSPPKRQTEVSDIELGRLPSADAQARQLVRQLAAGLGVPENVMIKRPRRLRRSTPSAISDSSTEVVSS